MTGSNLLQLYALKKLNESDDDDGQDGKSKNEGEKAFVSCCAFIVYNICYFLFFYVKYGVHEDNDYSSDYDLQIAFWCFGVEVPRLFALILFVVYVKCSVTRTLIVIVVILIFTTLTEFVLVTIELVKLIGDTSYFCENFFALYGTE